MRGSQKDSKQFESHILVWNVDFEIPTPYCFGKDNCTMAANSAG